MTETVASKNKDRIIEQLNKDNQNLRYCIGSLKSHINFLYAYLEIKHHKRFRNRFKLKKVA